MSGLSEEIAAVAAYLESVRENYPGGLPQDVLVGEMRAVQTVRTGAQPPVLIFLGELNTAVSAGNPFSDSERELLEAAIVRGLKMSLAEVAIVGLKLKGSAQQLLSQLAEICGDSPPKCLVLLGAKVSDAVAQAVDLSIAPGTVVDCRLPNSAVKVLATAGLAEVLASESTKREFWSDLKKVIALLQR